MEFIEHCPRNHARFSVRLASGLGFGLGGSAVPSGRILFWALNPGILKVTTGMTPQPPCPAPT
jgi:hypothetical protein